MNRVTKLALLFAISVFGMSAAPGVAPVTAAATPASFRVEPSYHLISSLNYGTGTTLSNLVVVPVGASAVTPKSALAAGFMASTHPRPFSNTNDGIGSSSIEKVDRSVVPH